MTGSSTVCPYCGKEVVNPEKLARHLARECAVVSTQEEIRQTDEQEREQRLGSDYR